MPRRSRAKLVVLVVVFLVLVVAGGVSYLAWRQSVAGPAVTASPPAAVGAKTPLVFTVLAARGDLVRAEVRVAQGGAPVVVARHAGPPAPRVELTARLEGVTGVREGGATLEVWAADDFWRPIRLGDRMAAKYPVTIDLTPPRLDVVGKTPYVAPGGSGVVIVRAPDASHVESRVGSLAFPTFPLGPEGTRVGFFALPYDFAAGTPVAVAARDEAGNAASRGVGAEVLPRKFRTDRIEVRDAFLQLKVPELLPQHPSSTPMVDGFLTINRDQRRQAEEEKRRVAARTSPTPLWEGAFLQPRNTKVFSNFAETRTYVYQGRVIDTQVHFGFDLASTKQASVPAANKGVVAFAAPLTIYGNTVIVDHGLGLMTLYGHLSSISVKPGDAVTRGQELGRTGTTGLALGDHLHYEVLVHGVSVTPVEWWDAKWIRDRVTGPLKAAGVNAIADPR
ncbi:MAG: peptidoglycan DD-metalloendopeptidase family protein [Candidatus Rokuibacteriota bacterium]